MVVEEEEDDEDAEGALSRALPGSRSIEGPCRARGAPGAADERGRRGCGGGSKVSASAALPEGSQRPVPSLRAVLEGKQGTEGGAKGLLPRL